ncbi:hypothetical protein DICPUDRAFT_93304 [Dictyostelium purpureum]|uniref:Uncharacterized protein n=1 Tax=Dictyostelium purpureum TaxID=5786 RepID=F1A5E0_DICPU|nr:uncharacterized protein DICPUDRAFT_93304 [Dictyostelium purpureum]EGC28593.1 hypothetical protein DICPUDRAFT_93304 [Dictyostelium purpureum]|eukprot:XP_003294882.1 hypothetical protein DICPUDRAFT_93304 [Dictyostelium purpureum]
MDIKLKEATSPKPTNQELLVKSPTYSRTKEERRENCGEMNHEFYLRNVSEKAELDNKRSQEIVDHNLREMSNERKEKSFEVNQELERGLEQRDKYIFEISEKGRKDVDHANKVHDRVMKNREKEINDYQLKENKKHLPQQ